MYVALSLLIIAIGAILQVGVKDSIEGVNLDNIGMILIIVGVVGFIFAVIAELMRRNRKTERVVESPQGTQREEIHQR
jgi:hypothetical protein